MAKFFIDELLRELEATDEAYVRRKLSLNGYTQVQRRHVLEWLNTKDVDRARAQANATLAISRRSVFWTMIGALGGLIAAVIGAIAVLAKGGL